VIASFVKSQKTRRVIALAAGLLLPLGFAPFDLYWLTPLSVALLFLLWEGQSPRESAVLGMCFGVAAFALGTYWLYISLRQLGGAPLPIVALLMGLMFAVMGVFVALTGALAARLAPAAGVIRWLVVMPAVWVLVEWLRGWVFTGFPWLSLGYSQLDTPLSQWSLVAGVHGVSWVVALIGGAFVALLTGLRRDQLAAAGALLIVTAATVGLKTQSWTEPREQALSIGMVQAAIPQELKWLPSQREPTLEQYKAATLALENVDLVIWPEAAIPGLPYEVMPFLQEMDDLLVERNVQLFSGILTFDVERGEYRNTLMAIGPELGLYYKRHLVPFGEYFPVPEFITQWLRLMNLPSEDIGPGPDVQAPLVAAGVPIAPTICYEVAFGAEQLVFLPEAELLVNVSNDTWFGDSIAPHQHLQMARMRSLETGRPMLRATNTGITAVIDANGEVLQRLPQFESGVLSAEIRPHTGATPYVRWGNTPLVLILVALVAAGALVPRRRA